MGRRFRAFYLAAVSVAVVGLVGSWFVASKPVESPSSVTSVALNANAENTRSYSSRVGSDSAFEPPMAMLAVPDFLLDPADKTRFHLAPPASFIPETDTDYAVLFSPNPLP